MKELNQKIGDMEYDGLITDTIPKTQKRGVVIRKITIAEGAEDKPVTLKRGTLLAKSSTDNKCIVLGSAEASEGETLEAYGILTDDTEVGSSEDVTAVIYTAGCFNTNKITVADGYNIKPADYDTLRKYGIVFKPAASA